MKLLAWDTSSQQAALVALEWPGADLKSSQQLEWSQVRILSEFFLDVALTHSDRLLWGIHQVLDSVRWKVHEIDCFGVGVGPGSFTGLRVGVTTARILASTLKKPLIGVSSLAALIQPLASSFSQLAPETWVIAATDACQGELFVRWGTAASMLRACERAKVQTAQEAQGIQPHFGESWEGVVRPSVFMEQFNQQLLLYPQRHWSVVGVGRQRYLTEWSRLPAAREWFAPYPFSEAVQGRSLGQLVWNALQDESWESGLPVLPHYCRVSSAEMRRGQ